ncbi:MAG TPA: hypothetical protein VFU99_10850 [Gaiellaceae bacterium]|nr:hypothetical protein [Gaiellaceae bacterium]
MRGDGLASATKFLVLTLSALYLLGAVGGVVLLDFDTTRDIVFWVLLLVLGATLMLVGQVGLRPGVLSAALVSVGAALGGLPLFWTLLVPIAVAAVIACSIALARRPAPAA